MMKINEATYPLANGELGKVAVFMYAGDDDPRPNLDYAVSNYVGDNKNYHELIDAQMNCPWVRVIVSNINDMKQLPFDEYLRRRTRIKKLKRIMNHE